MSAKDLDNLANMASMAGKGEIPGIADVKNNGFDINKVDYEWVANNSNIKELKRAYAALKEDGYFHELIKATGERICELDPKFARIFHGAPKMSYEEEKELNGELNDFFADMRAVDNDLKYAEDRENNSIFGNGGKKAPGSETSASKAYQNKKLAENERLKGNELMKAKDYDIAIGCYKRSLELDPK
jgi:tetratricopeptide (TPR) repeat protein